MKTLSVLTALLLIFPNLRASQQASAPALSSSSQTTILLAQSVVALTGRHAISDVTLSGTARRVAGSDDDTGTAVFKALASGAGRADLNLSSGQRCEIQNWLSSIPVGAWSGPDGVSHSIAHYNLMTDPSWFFPAFAISRALSASGYAVAYVGQETRNSQSVQHVQVWQVSAAQLPAYTPTLQHLSQMDFYIDSTTFLPAALTFNIHPDNDMGLDIPIEVRFSDYRPMNGTRVPFHVLKFLNNSLSLDFQVDSVTFDSGLRVGSFSL